MSDVREQTTSTTGAAQVPRQRGGREEAPQPTGWVGMIFFGAVMLVLLGAFQVIEGLVALFDDGYYMVTSNGLIVQVNYNAWGWVHLAVGVVALAAGIGLFTGKLWARVAAVAIASISAIVNLAFLAAFPVWAILMIVLDVLVIYAVTAHGKEVRAGM